METERDGILIDGPRGRIFTASIGGPNVYFYFEGHVDLEWFEPTMVFVNEALRAGGARLWGDGESWKSYAPGYRDAWTRWFLDNKDSVERTHLVIKSPLLRMGVQVVNLFASNPIKSLGASHELYELMRVEVPGARQHITASWPEDVAAKLRAHSSRSGLMAKVVPRDVK